MFALLVAAVLAFGLLAWIVRRHVIGPAARAVRDLSDAEALVREITDGVPGLAVFKVVRVDHGRMKVEFVSRGAAAVLGVPAVAIAAEWEHLYETVVPDDLPACAAPASAPVEARRGNSSSGAPARRDRWIRVEARQPHQTVGGLVGRGAT
jgi:hypothetical protein